MGTKIVDSHLFHRHEWICRNDFVNIHLYFLISLPWKTYIILVSVKTLLAVCVCWSNIFIYIFGSSKNFVGSMRVLVPPQADASVVLSQTHGIFNQVSCLLKIFKISLCNGPYLHGSGWKCSLDLLYPYGLKKISSDG